MLARSCPRRPRRSRRGDAHPTEIPGQGRGDPDLSPTRPNETHLYVSNDHFENWLDCIATRERPIVDVEIGHRMTCWCHLGNIAYTLGRKVHWDPVAERFLDDDAANRQLHYAYRQPWHL